MLELILAFYGCILWLVFKKWKLLPVNTYTMVTSGAIMVASLILLVLLLNFFQPVSKAAQYYAFTTPVVPNVRGRVIEVPVQPNRPLVAGDVLFRIDPTPYQARVDELNAELALARNRLNQAMRSSSIKPRSTPWAPS
ncbi:MAG: hypothetical protein ACYTF0_01030 [Planctomycetota bacterium]|jgi:multidrug resistance efflux pump